ncbi:hypothetical protein [Aliamphritea spongicola]|nr:hypothetical protein [Aliamphritea spongicola]
MSGNSIPDTATLNVFAKELHYLAKERRSGKLAEEINRGLPGSSSTIKSSARKLKKLDEATLASEGAERLLAAKKQWQDVRIWRTMKTSGEVFTDSFYLTATDLTRNEQGRSLPGIPTSTSSCLPKA